MEASLFSFFRNEAAPVEEADLTEFWRVWHLMDEKFAYGSSTERLTPEEKVEGAIAGMVERFDDPYTIFLPPTDASAFEEDIAGNFGGVGMEVGIRDGLVTVIAPLPDTPAADAGIIAGDVILEIDGTTTDGMSVDEAVKRIRGEEGTVVTLSLFREGANEPIEKSITRGSITIPTVETEVIGDVFVIRLYSFNALAEARMQEALRAYVESGQRKLLLDLRGNPGGYLQSAVAIASYFLPTGKVIVRESFGEGQTEEVYRSQGRTLRDAAPERMVVLVNQGSASASEILAGALREHDVATLIGEQTFGKGSVQELVPLPSGSSLKVTIARWLTPEGVNISENGLTPDIEVERTVEQILADEDPQQQAALEYLAR
jgi:carboxyl-terminal processing protease